MAKMGPKAREAFFSVKEVAGRLCRSNSPDEFARVMRQVRHWTASDLLTPLGGKHTGTGVSRVYDLQEVRKAAILAELSRYGITVQQLDGFSEWIDSLSATDKWKAAVGGTREVFIQMSWTEAGDAAWSIAFDSPTKNILTRESNRGSFQTLDGRSGKLSNPNFTSGIVISLTKLLEQIGA